MIIDTHVHYNLEPLNTDWNILWGEAQSEGIGSSIVVGTNRATSEIALEICQDEAKLYCSVGVHPEEDLKEFGPEMEMLQQLIDSKQNKKKKIVAIGECGLDYSKLPQDAPAQTVEKKRQKALFGKQIELAKRNNLPLIIHCRDAYDDLLDTIHHFSMTDGKAPRAILHCMSGTIEYLDKALALGFYISYAGNITFKNAENIRELARHTPLDRVLVETDAPFLAPQSNRGKTNQPKFILDTVDALAALYSIKADKMAKITAENAKKAFHLTA